MSTISPRVRAAVYLRDQQRCVRCGGSAEGGSVHHRKARGMGGTKDPRVNMAANLLTLCGSGTTGCHGWVESNRGLSRWDGYLLRDVATAEDTPVLTWQGWRTYGNDGKAYLVDGAA